MNRIRLERIPAKRGRSDEWMAVLEGSPRWGIGHTRAEAMDSLVRANLAAFGVDYLSDLDPEADPPECVWRAGDYSPAPPQTRPP